MPPVPADAGLVAACARFCAFEREWRTANLAADRMPHDDPERDHMDVLTDPLQNKQRLRVAEIVAMTCTTLAGVCALAEALAEWDQNLFNGNTHTNELLTARLVQAVLAMEGQRTR